MTNGSAVGEIGWPGLEQDWGAFGALRVPTAMPMQTIAVASLGDMRLLKNLKLRIKNQKRCQTIFAGLWISRGHTDGNDLPILVNLGTKPVATPAKPKPRPEPGLRRWLGIAKPVENLSRVWLQDHWQHRIARKSLPGAGRILPARTGATSHYHRDRSAAFTPLHRSHSTGIGESQYQRIQLS